MIRLNIHDAKTHLSRYLERVAKGETIVLCKRNVPVAEIRALPAVPTRPRPIGLARGELVVPPEFFLPLPGDLQAAFEEGAVGYLARLPSVHADPFDRMLVCQALAHGLTLLTPDAWLQRYPVPSLW